MNNKKKTHTIYNFRLKNTIYGTIYIPMGERESISCN